MANQDLARRLAVIVHADVVGSTALVRRDDPLAIQEAVAGKINQTLGSLNGVLLGQVARQRAWVKDSVDLDEHDFVLRGHEYFLRWTQDEVGKARDVFEQGIERFPDSALLKAKIAWARYTQVLQGWSPNPEADFKTAIELAEEVLADSRTSLLAEFLAHWVLGFLYASSDTPRAMDEMNSAVALVPGDGMARADLAGFQFWAGAAEDGWRSLAMAERVDPGYAWIPYYKAFGHRLERDCRKAMDAMQAFYESPLKYLFIAACSARLNETEQANVALGKAEKLWPGVSISTHRDSLWFTDQTVVQEYLDDLRKAGLSE